MKILIRRSFWKVLWIELALLEKSFIWILFLTLDYSIGYLNWRLVMKLCKMPVKLCLWILLMKFFSLMLFGDVGLRLWLGEVEDWEYWRKMLAWSCFSFGLLCLWWFSERFSWLGRWSEAREMEIKEQEKFGVFELNVEVWFEERIGVLLWQDGLFMILWMRKEGSAWEAWKNWCVCLGCEF